MVQVTIVDMLSLFKYCRYVESKILSFELFYLTRDRYSTMKLYRIIYVTPGGLL